MLEISGFNPLVLIAGIAGLIIGLQIILSICLVVALRVAGRERIAIHREIFGLVKRLEGLTANRREQVLKHYDAILDNLSKTLPPTIAAQTSDIIFDTESKILTRLAELEPNLKHDELSRRKMDDLIKNMENLEKTIVVLASDTVRRVMTESRRVLLDDTSVSDSSLAA